MKRKPQHGGRRYATKAELLAAREAIEDAHDKNRFMLAPPKIRATVRAVSKASPSPAGQQVKKQVRPDHR